MSRVHLAVLWVNYLAHQSLAYFNSPISPRIWNGFEARNQRDFPFFAAIVNRSLVESGEIQVVCGGTIIAQTELESSWIVTSASAVLQDWDQPIESERGWITQYDAVVALNSLASLREILHDPEKRDTNVKIIKDIIIHPDFVGDRNGRKHDIALLKMLSPVVFVVGTLSGARLPVHREGYYYAHHKDMYYVAGFGSSRPYTPQSVVLKGTTMKVKNNSWCQSAFTMSFFGKERRKVALFDAHEQLCCDGNTSHVCEGDFGAGLVGVPNKKKADFEKTPPTDGYLMGVLSWTPVFSGCGLALPSVFTRITQEKLKWLDNNIINDYDFKEIDYYGD